MPVLDSAEINRAYLQYLYLNAEANQLPFSDNEFMGVCTVRNQLFYQIVTRNVKPGFAYRDGNNKRVVFIAAVLKKWSSEQVALNVFKILSNSINFPVFI